MAEAFPVSGNIEPASFPHLLVDLHRHGATGSLKVSGPQHPKALYFRAGRILFGSSNDPRDQLGSILIESGRITRDQLDEVNAKVGPGNPLAKVLAESGFVNQRELGDAARVKVERILADVLSWSSGTFEFEDGVLPKGAVDLKLSTEKLLLAAVERVPDRAFALRHVELSTVLEPAPEGESALAEVRSEVSPLLERLDGSRTLKDAVALTRLDEFEAAKIACAMLFLGIVRRGKQSGQELDLAQEAQSGFGGEEPQAGHFTVPAEPAATAPPADEQPTAFAFAEPTPPGVPATASTEATMVLGFPAIEPEPGVTTDSEPLGVLPDETPTPAPSETPAFFVDAQARPRPGTDTQPGNQPAYAPPASEPEPTLVLSHPPPTYEPPAPEPAPAPAYAPPAYEPQVPEPAPAPAYRPPAYEPPPAPSIPDIAPPPTASSRPTPEDLAALDALLNPSATGRLGAAAAPRPRTERAFDSRSATIPPRRLPARPPVRSAPSRVPLLVIALAGIAVATVAAWYFLLRSPAPLASPAPRPTAIARATPAPPPVVAPGPSPASSATAPGQSAPLPTPAASVTPTTGSALTPPPAAAPVPAPGATPTPTASPALTAIAKATPAPASPGAAAKPGPPGSAVDARALMRQGALSDAARAFAASLTPGARSRFSLQVLVACAPENVQKAIAAVPRDELFIVPVSVKGKECYRVCWGEYESRPAAEAALRTLPAYFRQGGAAPRLAPLAELLP